MALIARRDDDEAFSSPFHTSQVKSKERQKKSEFGIHEVYEMALEQHPTMSVEDYFALEENSEERYEYVDGRVYMMAGATKTYDTIKANMERNLWAPLRGSGCRTYSSDMRVFASPTRYYHPDVTISCNSDNLDEEATVRSPRVVIEVLSPGTIKTDYKEKLRAYLACPTIETYMLVDSWSMLVTMYHKEDQGQWRFQFFKGDDEVVIPGLNLHLSLADIYLDVHWKKEALENKSGYISGKTMPVEDYRKLELLDDVHYEYIDGKTYLIDGNTANHSQIRRNMELIMYWALRRSGPCHSFGYGMQILLKSEASERLDFVYPDVTVSCAAADWKPESTLIEAPRVVVEVLAARTELKDRREKLQAYLACPTLEAYVLVDLQEPYVEMYYKDGKQCCYQFFRAGDEIVLPGLDVRFAVDEIYDELAFAEMASEREREEV